MRRPRERFLDAANWRMKRSETHATLHEGLILVRIFYCELDRKLAFFSSFFQGLVLVIFLLLSQIFKVQDGRLPLPIWRKKFRIFPYKLMMIRHHKSIQLICALFCHVVSLLMARENDARYLFSKKGGRITEKRSGGISPSLFYRDASSVCSIIISRKLRKPIEWVILIWQLEALKKEEEEE